MTISRLFTILLVLASVYVAIVPAQKNEHYNSPLYSPRKYEPGKEVASGLPKQLNAVGITQRLGETLPLDAAFKDENGSNVILGDYFNKGRPVILALVYYECPMLCNQVLNGLTGTLKGIALDTGKDYDVVAISFDAKENGKPDLARNKKASYMERYGRPGTEKGWHFLTGEQTMIDRVTESVGFTYEWDEATKQFAHASGIMIVTPEGRLSRYFYGIDYAPRDVKLGLVESAENKVGSVTDQLLLYCFHYDPSTGKYGFAILNLMRAAAVATLLGMGAMGFVFWRRNKSKRQE
ncbi:MAG: SCO family protein [Blastocatellia bacterium]|nr:SCO family protein [Chloracidobacterium sp.]MBL8186130.1 SCO family protein [Blastocatellia bacterium]HRJ88515.1 SCO family protein [Pyrinomonadaceae bacterium]HRK50438.1 SCO family protein [Pyrinomonadaceae bacterium]